MVVYLFTIKMKYLSIKNNQNSEQRTLYISFVSVFLFGSDSFVSRFTNLLTFSGNRNSPRVSDVGNKKEY